MIHRVAACVGIKLASRRPEGITSEELSSRRIEVARAEILEGGVVVRVLSAKSEGYTLSPRRPFCRPYDEDE